MGQTHGYGAGDARASEQRPGPVNEVATSTGTDEGAALVQAWLASRARQDRNAVVAHFAGLAHHIARRYQRPHDRDDVHQVALIGLVKAADRFDPTFGVPFAAYAGTTIEGELRRYRRDHDWVVRVPRSLKELRTSMHQARRELEQQLRRSPTVDELAAALAVGRDEVLQAMAADDAMDVSSTDAMAESGQQRAAAVIESGYETVVNRTTVEALLETLPERERRLVELCFLEGRSQAEAAEVCGISQMHVSRLLRRAIETLRTRAQER